MLLRSMSSMKKDERLSQTRDFNRVLDRGSSWTNGFLVLRASANGLGSTRYGFITSKRLGSAVIRNRLRRRLREIMRTMPLKTGWDIVLIGRPKAAETDFSRLKKAVKALLYQSELLAQEDEKIYLKTN